MKKTCPICMSDQEAISFHLSDKELLNMRKLGLSEDICSQCYSEQLSILLESTKPELIKLNEAKESTQAAYYQAYNAWKEQANLFKAIDYNIAIITHNKQKKEAAKTQKVKKPKEPASIQLLAKKLLASLSQEQQDAIIRTFQTQQPE